MPRPKEFDPEQALDRAMEVFWHRGYTATSVQDLVDGMGINRGSLYDTFGDKHQLFLAALRRYEREHVSEVVTVLERPGPVREAIRAVLDRFVEQGATCTRRRGCLLTNSVVELAPHDPEAAEQVRDNLRRVENALERALRRGQGSGEIPTNRDPRALARFLTSTLQGMRVMAKASPDRSALQDVADVALGVLE